MNNIFTVICEGKNIPREVWSIISAIVTALSTVAYVVVTCIILNKQSNKDKLLEYDSYLLCIKQTIGMLNKIWAYLRICPTPKTWNQSNANSAEIIRDTFYELNNHVDSHIRFYGAEQSSLQDIFNEVVVSKMLEGDTISEIDRDTQMEKITKLIELFETLHKNAVIKAKELSYIK